MADYYPLIARAVEGLEKNSSENRRALYERARTALVAQLRGVVPALDESEITRERLALEEAIRKIEADSARRVREEPRPTPPPRRPTVEQVRRDDAARPTPPPPRAAPPAPRSSPSPSTAPSTPREPVMPRGPSPSGSPSTAERSSLADEALKGFRDTPEPARSREQREPLRAERPSTPPPPPPPRRQEPNPLQELGQLEPSLAPEDPWAPPGGHRTRREEPSLDFEDARTNQSGRPRPPRQTPLEEPVTPRPVSLRNYRGMIRTGLIVLAVVLVGAVGWWQRGAIGSVTGSIMALVRGSPSVPAQRDAGTQPRTTKIPDRIGQPAAVPSVAQRVVLYEEDPSDAQGKRFIGSAVWRTEMMQPSPGRAPEFAVRADVTIPERNVTMSLSLRRNTDQSLPASHTIEIMFNVPPDVQGGGVQNVPGVLMKQAEATRGVPLAGLAVKVTPGFFLIGLSALESDMQRNLQLLRERSWFDIPIVYNNNRRAILAVEKGTPGEKAFNDAFATWRQ